MTERDYAYIKVDGGIPVFDWAGAEAGALVQAENLARLPVALDHIALMPDAHQGYGMPIGGVMFTDKAVVPYAIGVDIGCGVVLLKTGMNQNDMSDLQLRQFIEAIYQTVPTGFNVKAQNEYTQEQLDLVMEMEVPESVKPEWAERALSQQGTLGGGNHFIEVQNDENGDIYVMLHSGSRSLGKNICDFYHKLALEENQRYHSPLPDKWLAFIPVGAPQFKRYWSAMEYALRWAEVNRDTMLMRVIDALYAVFPAADEVTIVADCHHNYAVWENHGNRNGIVHRKGAVRARSGDVVLIPGSMGTGSYVGRGLGNDASFHSCQHGAGRAMSRTAAMKTKTSEEVYAHMESVGVILASSSPKDVGEEAPWAYKDIEDVMDRSTGLVEQVTKLKPLGVVKG